ncbi:hypothetical protein Krad_1742 [Kineococcus radiotolerans SRS30216 = ATCC BAA-149]|uniref:Uncharacterized protein n=1 Tax=Kineococcus radiotolerans (strain ATCC BAA-149 / DSM 14245 / SRS30216) TaxID=266940 RepID=A6W8T9_KINRD|nr:hypothetical protein Krad_1742 [Kineococcus radiotolerans SRS30216 = ATCC BAA-149]
MIRIVPATHVSGGRTRPGQRVLLIVRTTPAGPRKLGTTPCPRWLWERLRQRWIR